MRDALYGVEMGGLFGGLSAGLVAARSGIGATVLAVLGGALLGAALLAILELLRNVKPTALWITIARKVGLPVGYAILGALMGAALELWQHQVQWSKEVPFTAGIFALIFAGVGWDRARRIG